MKYDHCRILLSDAMLLRDKKQQGWINRHKMAGWGYDCQVQYFLSSGEVKTEVLSTIDEAIDYDPFAKGIAILSSNGWEMVAAQHAEEPVAYDEKSKPFNTISGRRQVAYFKKRASSV